MAGKRRGEEEGTIRGLTSKAVTDTDVTEGDVLPGGAAYLICVVKAVIHEPCDQRRLPHCKTQQKRERERRTGCLWNDIDQNREGKDMKLVFP